MREAGKREITLHSVDEASFRLNIVQIGTAALILTKLGSVKARESLAL